MRKLKKLKKNSRRVEEKFLLMTLCNLLNFSLSAAWQIFAFYLRIFSVFATLISLLFAFKPFEDLWKLSEALWNLKRDWFSLLRNAILHNLCEFYAWIIFLAIISHKNSLWGVSNNFPLNASDRWILNAEQWTEIKKWH